MEWQEHVLFIAVIWEPLGDMSSVDVRQMNEHKITIIPILEIGKLRYK